MAAREALDRSRRDMWLAHPPPSSPSHADFPFPLRRAFLCSLITLPPRSPPPQPAAFILSHYPLLCLFRKRITPLQPRTVAPHHPPSIHASYPTRTYFPSPSSPPQKDNPTTPRPASTEPVTPHPPQDGQALRCTSTSSPHPSSASLPSPWHPVPRRSRHSNPATTARPRRRRRRLLSALATAGVASRWGGRGWCGWGWSREGAIGIRSGMGRVSGVWMGMVVVVGMWTWSIWRIWGGWSMSWKADVDVGQVRVGRADRGTFRPRRSNTQDGERLISAWTGRSTGWMYWT